jgi:hypothetical protein
MKEDDVYAELSSIRDLMERSSKFISLSGLSGVLAGVYALAGAGLAYFLIKDQPSSDGGGQYLSNDDLLWQLCTIGVVVLALSILTACWLTIRNARAKNAQVWNPVSRRLLTAMCIPLFTGGIFIIIMLLKGEYSLVAFGCLTFYGLALVAASQYTYNEVKWLGICQIVLGLLALIYPAQGLLLWTLGFSLLHILYGSIMHFKYDR